MPLDIITGDLLNVPTGADKYIVQQCCCTSTRTAGLSQAIVKKWPALNPYARRTAVGKTHTSTMDSRPYHGSAELLTDGSTNLICLYAQYGPGKPGIYEDDFIIMPDGGIDRLQYFKRALKDTLSIVEKGSTLYFPYGIGCGLAGGKWEKYEQVLKDFAAENPDLKIVVVRLK